MCNSTYEYVPSGYKRDLIGLYASKIGNKDIKQSLRITTILTSSFALVIHQHKEVFRLFVGAP